MIKSTKKKFRYVNSPRICLLKFRTCGEILDQNRLNNSLSNYSSKILPILKQHRNLENINTNLNKIVLICFMERNHL